MAIKTAILKKLRIMLISVLFILLFSSFTPHSFHSALFYENDFFSDGDVIFRRGTSFVSRVVLFVDAESQFSHTGIIVRNGSEVKVIHSVPGESGDNPDYIKMESIYTYLMTDRASGYAVYRLQNFDSTVISVVVSNAVNYFERRLMFDDDFDLDNSEKLYCTELVWRAYLSANIDLTAGLLDTLNFPLKRGEFILPSTLINSPFLTNVYSYFQ